MGLLQWAFGNGPMAMDLWQWAYCYESLAMDLWQWAYGNGPMAMDLWQWVYSIETRQGKGKIIGFFPTNQITLYLLH